MVAELLYLEKQGQSLPIEMLINSSGTTRQDGEIVSALTLGFICSPSIIHGRVDLASQAAALYLQWRHRPVDRLCSAIQGGAQLPDAQGCRWLSTEYAFMCMSG